MDGRVNGSISSRISGSINSSISGSISSTNSSTISSTINGTINGIKTAVKRLKRNRFTAVLFPPFSEIEGRGSIQPACKKSFLLIFPNKINRFTKSQ